MKDKYLLAERLANIRSAIENFKIDLEEAQLQPTHYADSGKQKLLDLNLVLATVVQDMQDHFSDWADVNLLSRE